MIVFELIVSSISKLVVGQF